MDKFRSKLLKTSDENFKEKLKLLLQSRQTNQSNLYKTVYDIIEKVKKEGDLGLKELVQQFDKIKLNKIEELYISKNILKEAYLNLKKEEKIALDLSAKRIKEFHEHQKPSNIDYKDHIEVKLGLNHTPIEGVGFYVPGGKAIYPSSLLMTAIPALVAGVSRRVVVSPISDLDKSSIVLAAAYVAEVTDFICMGGAHSIGALAYGTETITPVNKIVGPGNAYVAEAKRQVFGKVGIDSIAGPSEVLIVADKTANPNYVAIDLLSQAEHDEQAQAILLTNDLELAQNVQVSIERFLKELPRSKIASSSWNDFGSIILVENFDEAIDLVNEVAPEHLQLMTSNAENLLKKIKNAGAIFIGHFTPEAVGDYIAGPNHVLPTNGTAKFSSGLGVLDFCKRTTIVEFNKNNLDAIGKNVVTLAKAEGLEAHAMSVALRLNNK
jgi:histidinol dehydrogenase